MTRILTCLTGMVFLAGVHAGVAQEANNPLLYSYQAVQFSDLQAAHDPVTLVMPGTAFSAGFGSFLDNPASAALYENSFGSFGMAFRNVNEESLFLGNRNGFSDNQTSISNLGFVYQFPVQQGRMVLGAGYSQHSFYNRAMEISGRNPNSTITDQFKLPGSVYNDIAFNTFATDYGDEFEDWDESIFRIGFSQPGDYMGIYQEGEILQRGFGGEYALFLATEFQRNLMVGVSLGVQSGRHTYDRIFLEIDRDGDYEGDFIDSSGDGEGDTDIDKILLTDDIISDYLAFKARVGALYRVNDHLNLGLSYTFPSRLTVNERFDARIATTFDNGVVFDDDLSGEFTYKVSSPYRAGLGLGLTDLGGLSVSLSAEYVDYSRTSLDFDADNFEEERDENQFISNNYTDVWNLRGGIAYDFNEQFSLRAGYGYFPSRFRNIDLDRNLYSLGAGFALNRDIRLEIGAQYAVWNEGTAVYNPGVYDYSVLPGEPPIASEQSEIAQTDVSRLQILATLRVRLY